MCTTSSRKIGVVYRKLQVWPQGTGHNRKELERLRGVDRRHGQPAWDAEGIPAVRPLALFARKKHLRFSVVNAEAVRVRDGVFVGTWLRRRLHSRRCSILRPG